MYSNHYQAETTGVVIGRRQGHQAGYTEGWNAAIDQANARINEQEATINDLRSTLNAMFVLAYPALATIHHSNDRDIQDFFVKHYEASIRQNGDTLQHIPHQDPRVLAFDQAIQAVINRWVAAAHDADSSPSP